MARNSIKSLVIVGSLFLALLLGVPYAYFCLALEKAFALHEHEKRESVKQPCLVVQEGPPISKGSPRASIQDCPLLGPEDSHLDILVVNLRTGLFVVARTDILIPSRVPIALTRVYRPDTTSRAFGLSSAHTYNIFLSGDRWPYTYIDLWFEDATRIHYDRVSSGIGYGDAVYEHSSLGSVYQGSRIRWTGSGWELERTDGWRYFFPPSEKAVRSSQAALWSLRDPDGRFLKMSRERSGDLRRIESPDGSWISLEYEDHKIVRATDSLGRSVGYVYDARDRLIKVQEAKHAIELSYDDSHYLRTMTTNGALSFSCEYHVAGPLLKLAVADRIAYQLQYQGHGEGQLETTITAPNGEVAVVSSSRTGYTVRGWRSQ